MAAADKTAYKTAKAADRAGRKQGSYIAIDLKSYYASAECAARGLDPFKTNLVVADSSRTDKTICLAVSPSLKAYGIPGRARLFEVRQRVREVNAARLSDAVRKHRAVWTDKKAAFSGASYDADELSRDPGLELDFIIAAPRMAYYVETSAKIYSIYLNYVSPEDMVVYSIDEVFIDAAPYMNIYGMTAHELAMSMIRDVLKETGITATAGIGSNLYLAKLAMDIVAKHAMPDKDGVRIAELNERSFRTKLWGHKPLTSFWMTGPGTAARLNAHGIYTMGDLARASIRDQEWFYRQFGVDAEILIDHAWGIEPCGLSDIKAYRPDTTSLSESQVLTRPYSCEAARLIVREMADDLVMQLTEREMTAGCIALGIGYDRENCDSGSYRGEVHIDRYGRRLPKSAHKSMKISDTGLGSRLIPAVLSIYDEISDRTLTIRRISISFSLLKADNGCCQLNIFTDTAAMEREKRLQQAMLKIRHRYGYNAVLKGTSYEEGATQRMRSKMIGGHKA